MKFMIVENSDWYIGGASRMQTVVAGYGELKAFATRSRE